MKVASIPISVSEESKFHGTIELSKNYEYEVFGPFGIGYNIRVFCADESGELHFVRDGSCPAKTRRGRILRSYELSDTAIYSRRDGELLKLENDSEIPEIEDEVALALLILNHHYWNGTGPFTKGT
ncbi:hypothetical protein HNR46_004176 [Haloferula luteola]|uniref:Uncharacterized protein n=1 Tax=Haloferula luteola TaxID=595692 RepID=A0A840VMR5_9BACT|nr:hypothetical protein [Haloferula luteola]MBB5353911.1 hypothetical protein [Haloferula luteola]